MNKRVKVIIGMFFLIFSLIVIYVPENKKIYAEDNLIVRGLAANTDIPYGVTLTWNHVEGADGYIIYRRVGNGNFEYLYLVSNNSYTDINASIEEYNFYRVYPYQIMNGKRILGKSETYVYAKANIGTVNNLSVKYTGANAVTLTWDEVDDVTGYIIYRKTGNGDFKYLYMVGKTNYIDTSVVYDEYNFYRVYPYIKRDSDRILGKSANYVYIKPVVGKSTNLKAVYNDTNDIVLTWDKVENVTGYIIYRKTGNAKFEYLYMTSSTSFTDTKADNSQYNFYRVYPYVKTLQGRVLGASENYVYGTLDGTSQINIKASNQRTITLQWNKVSGADGYIIYRKKNSEESFSYRWMTSSCTWIDQELMPGEYYSYRIYAYRNIGESRLMGPSLQYVYAKAVSASPLQGLVTIDGKYYYYLSNGSLRKGFSIWDDIGKAYFDEETGEMLLGIQTVKQNGYTYCFKQGGGVETGLKNVDGKTYYFNENSGVMEYGYKNIDGIPYYFDQSTGEMQSGAIEVELSTGNFTFYFLEEGGIYKGFKEIDGELYYFNIAQGEMVKGTMMEIDDKKYYFDDLKGNAVTGIVNVKSTGYTYYFDKDSPLGVRTGLQKYENDEYFFDNNSGIMKYGYWSINDKYYFFDYESGKMLKNGEKYEETIGLKFIADSEGELTCQFLEGQEENPRAVLFSNALAKIGVKYGTGPDELVCSSFVAYAYNSIGIDLLNDLESFEQAKICKDLGYFIDVNAGDIDDLIVPGDVIFWQNLACEDAECNHIDEVHHIGIYLGNGQVVEASESKGVMLIEDIQESETFRIYGYAKLIS